MDKMIYVGIMIVLFIAIVSFTGGFICGIKYVQFRVKKFLQMEIKGER